MSTFFYSRPHFPDVPYSLSDLPTLLSRFTGLTSQTYRPTFRDLPTSLSRLTDLIFLTNRLKFFDLPTSLPRLTDLISLTFRLHWGGGGGVATQKKPNATANLKFGTGFFRFFSVFFVFFRFFRFFHFGQF